MIPWMYHRLTPRDQAGDLLRVMNFTQTVNNLNVITYQVPNERILLLNHLHIYQEDIAGSAANVISGITLDTTTVFSFTLLRDIQVTGAGVYREYHKIGSPALIVPPLHVLTFVNNNPSGVGCILTVSMNGLLVPHGTFSE